MGFRICSEIPILMKRIKTGRVRHVITMFTLSNFTSWARPSFLLSSPRNGQFGYLFKVQSMALSSDGVAQTVKEIKFEDLKQQINNDSIILIDVREQKELVKDGAIPKSINIPLGDVKGAFSLSSEKFQDKYGIPLPSRGSTNIVLSCQSGRRAAFAVEELHKIGYTNVKCYYGSFLDWKAKGGEIMNL